MPTKNEAHTDLLPGLCVRKAENVIWKRENKKLKDPIQRRILPRCLNWKRAARFWFNFKIHRQVFCLSECIISNQWPLKRYTAGCRTTSCRKWETHGDSSVTVSHPGWSRTAEQLWLPTLKCSTKHMRLPASDKGIAVVSLTPRIWSDLFFLSIPDRILLYVGLFPAVGVTSSILALYSKCTHVSEKGL